MDKVAMPEGKYLASVKLGPKGQIVVPKEVREMFGIRPGDTLLLLADVNRGIALQTFEKADPVFRDVFSDREDRKSGSAGMPRPILLFHLDILPLWCYK